MSLLTFIFFLRRNLVDYKQGHQVHTMGPCASGGCRQAHPQVFPFLLHFSLFEELLGERQQHDIMYIWTSSCKTLEIVAVTLCFLASLLATSRFLQREVVNLHVDLA